MFLWVQLNPGPLLDNKWPTNSAWYSTHHGTQMRFHCEKYELNDLYIVGVKTNYLYVFNNFDKGTQIILLPISENWYLKEIHFTQVEVGTLKSWNRMSSRGTLWTTVDLKKPIWNDMNFFWHFTLRSTSI